MVWCCLSIWLSRWLVYFFHWKSTLSWLAYFFQFTLVSGEWMDWMDKDYQMFSHVILYVWAFLCIKIRDDYILWRGVCMKEKKKIWYPSQGGWDLREPSHTRKANQLSGKGACKSDGKMWRTQGSNFGHLGENWNFLLVG